MSVPPPQSTPQKEKKLQNDHRRMPASLPDTPSSDVWRRPLAVLAFGGLRVTCRARSLLRLHHPLGSHTPSPLWRSLWGRGLRVHRAPPLHVERISPGRRLALFPVFVKICTKPPSGMEPTL